VRRLLILLVAFGALWCAPGAFAAGWCGSGEAGHDRPDVTTGQQIHAIYAVPSDGADTFAAGVGQEADDIGSLSAWWTGQDPTRVPRFDLADFGGRTCVDVSFVRLPESGALLTTTGANGAFTLLSQELEDEGWDSPYKKYLVYYAGPAPEQGVCGIGDLGPFTSGPSFAVVWLGGCSDVPTDGVAAHELIHALGALPLGAPHACTPANDPLGESDSGHPCDSPSDILYPVSSGLPLAQLVLDAGHDDYYAHAGAWDDLQDSLWLHRLDAAQVPLAVAVSGGGKVTSDVPGVDCTASCTSQWDASWRLKLAPTPAASTRFVRWQGGCVGVGDCSLTMSAARSVTAVFGPRRVPVSVGVSGRGSVVCQPDCSSHFRAGARLYLNAVPAKGWRFAGWSGACRGRSIVCRPATDFAVSARAIFVRKR
jgi:hypothetical protein